MEAPAPAPSAAAQSEEQPSSRTARLRAFHAAAAAVSDSSPLKMLLLRAADHDPELADLELSGNQELIRWPAARQAAALALLAGSRRLIKLCLSGLHLQDEVCPALALLLAEESALEVLNLERNDFHEYGLLQLISSLASNATLRELRLTGQRTACSTAVESALADQLDAGGASALVRLGLPLRNDGIRRRVDAVLFRHMDHARQLRQATRRGTAQPLATALRSAAPSGAPPPPLRACGCAAPSAASQRTTASQRTPTAKVVVAAAPAATAFFDAPSPAVADAAGGSCLRRFCGHRRRIGRKARTSSPSALLASSRSSSQGHGKATGRSGSKARAGVASDDVAAGFGVGVGGPVSDTAGEPAPGSAPSQAAPETASPTGHGAASRRADRQASSPLPSLRSAVGVSHRLITTAELTADERAAVSAFADFMAAKDAAAVQQTYLSLVACIPKLDTPDAAAPNSSTDDVEHGGGRWRIANISAALTPLLPYRARALLHAIETRAAQPNDARAAQITERAMAMRAVVVGAGPVGLRCAIELACLGLTVDVLERRHGFTRLQARIPSSKRMRTSVAWSFLRIRYCTMQRALASPYAHVALRRRCCIYGIGLRRT